MVATLVKKFPFERHEHTSILVDCHGAGWGCEASDKPEHIARVRSHIGDPCYTCGGPMTETQKDYYTTTPSGGLYRCQCGREFDTRWIRYDPIDCECGRCYNLSGQELDAHAAHCYICGELGGECGYGEN